MGGGTEYPTQKEALEMLGCQGRDRKYSLAEAIAAFCLAGEVGKAAEFAKNGRGAGQRGLERGKL